MPIAKGARDYTVEVVANTRFGISSAQHAFQDVATARQWARRHLRAAATIVEREQLPGECEVIRRVGTIATNGQVTWRRR